MKVPNLYTEVEGGRWLFWPYGIINPLDLKQRAKATVLINGHYVHSLFWGDSDELKHVNLPSASRWDCINGWTDNPLIEEGEA